MLDRPALFALASCVLALLAVAPADAREESTFRLLDGLEMAYVERGAGAPALVLVHCGNCRKEVWSETLDAFAPTHRVVAMDLPGHGRSGAGRARFTIPDLGADVAALVDGLGLGRVVLVGNSLGGPVALEAAKLLGARRVLGIVAVDTLQNVEAVWPEESWRRRLEGYRQDFPASCAELMGLLLPKSAPDATRERLRRETCHNDAAAAIALFETLHAYDTAAALRAAGVPVRAINSAGFPTDLAANRKYEPTFDAVLMEGVGHYPQFERPEEFQRHLRRLVDDLSSAP